MSSIFNICTFLRCYTLGFYLEAGIFCLSLRFLRAASNGRCKFIKNAMGRVVQGWFIQQIGASSAILRALA